MEINNMTIRMEFLPQLGNEDVITKYVLTLIPKEK